MNFNVMRVRMAKVWQPGRGVEVVDLGGQLYLFRFFHEFDIRWVVDCGPWTFDSHLLVLHELRAGEQLGGSTYIRCGFGFNSITCHALSVRKLWGIR
ncbi:hypothetical protein LINGRAPRIM_LOCUS2901 [Linum grandiflorum]